MPFGGEHYPFAVDEEIALAPGGQPEATLPKGIATEAMEEFVPRAHEPLPRRVIAVRPRGKAGILGVAPRSRGDERCAGDDGSEEALAGRVWFFGGGAAKARCSGPTGGTSGTRGGGGNSPRATCFIAGAGVVGMGSGSKVEGAGGGEDGREGAGG